ncbi:MAG: sigma 54-interacting transcriptional regulator [Alphaproteobacteria bacterium]|nr:sigma 54-interacting transcriptional regulator [Alphaproteobacteria bacterium]
MPSTAQTISVTGCLVLDAALMPQFRAGIAAAAEIADAVIASLRRAPAAQQRVRALVAGARKHVMVALPGDGATAVVLHGQGEDDSVLFDFVASVDFAAAILRHFLTSPFEALTVVDDKAIVRFVSPVHERFFGLDPGAAIGRPATAVIENTRLPEVVRSGRAEIGQVQEMRGVRRVVSRFPIHAEGRVVGAIGQVMFREPEQLHALSRELAKLRSEVAFYKRELSGLRGRAAGLDRIVGTSDATRQLKQDIAKLAPLDVPVLLLGESGTGKELAAQALHELSPRHGAAMVLVNASALPASLVESELFGYEPGAFTGADRKGRKGKVAQADSGTLFLDEIGDMPLELQPKLLRVLQDGTYERVGGERPQQSDFRLVTATNRDLAAMARDGSFRLDLYYRISAVTLRLAPLRERPEDIPALVQRFVEDHARRFGRPVRGISPQALAWLKEQPWPGNVRELLHAIERAAIFCEGAEIGLADLEPAPRRGSGGAAPQPTAMAAPAGGVRAAQAAVELAMIRDALARLGGNKKRAAEALGISRAHLYKRLGEMKPDEGAKNG